MTGSTFSFPRIDLGRLSKQERRSFEHRDKRLAPGSVMSDSVAGATCQLTKRVTVEHLVLRRRYVHLAVPIDEGVCSDRKAPPRALRPSATRITSSRGVTLAFHLTILGVAQSTTRSRGARARLPELPIKGDNATVGWTDLIASDAVASGKGTSYSTVRDKKTRSLQSSLNTLENARLVELQGPVGSRDRYKSVTLLDETGHQLPTTDPIPYTIPTPKEATFSLPATFLTRGWVHVLSDSEISVLLMVASTQPTPVANLEHDLREGEVIVPADQRLRGYGIHRDPFSTAVNALSRFGLLGIREVNRHSDGRAVDDERYLHRLTLHRDVFADDPLDRLRAAFNLALRS